MIFVFQLASIYLRIFTALLQGKSKRSIVIKLARENLFLKRQIQILKRKSCKLSVMTAWDRLFFAFILNFGNARHHARRCSVLFSPDTLLKCHRYFVRMKYSRLYGSSKTGKRGPKGKPREIKDLVIAIKKNNPDYGAEKIAGLLCERGHRISESTVRRILKKYWHPENIRSGPSWLSFIANTVNGLWSVDLFRCESSFLKSFYVMVVLDVFSRRIMGLCVEKYPLTGSDVCRMFLNVCKKAGINPKRISTDNDPLFEFHRWGANLRLMEIDEIKTVPYVPWSHPHVERVIGTIRKEYLDKILFFSSGDLKRKLEDFKTYYNEGRVHSSLDFLTPCEKASFLQPEIISFENIKWKSYCKQLFRVPIAA